MQEIGGGLVMDVVRTDKVLTLAAYSWQNRLLSFSTMESPEIWHLLDEIRPGSRMHSVAIFLASLFSRSGKLADDVIPKAFRLLVERPDLADPRKVRKVFRPEDRYLLEELIAFAKDDPARVEGFIMSMRILKEKYDGDPRNIFLSLSPIEDLMQARRMLIGAFEEFPGIGNKIAQLAIVWFQDTDWSPARGVRNHREQWEWIRKIPAMPVDIWILRLTRQLGLVRKWESDHRDRVTDRISEFYSERCLEGSINWSLASQALWHAGSRLCGRLPENDDRRSLFCFKNCPFYDFCRGVMGTNAKLRGRGKLGWGSHFRLHWRVFPQPLLDSLYIPDNDGSVHLPLAKKEKPRPRQIDPHLRLFEPEDH